MLLCLQGFRGEGYDARFIENMNGIHARLNENPKTQVCLTDHPDQICEACPNLKDGCALRGPGFEEQMASQDRKVLKLLGLKPGQQVTWGKLLSAIGSRIRSDQLNEICGTCPWLPLGYCKEGLDSLASCRTLPSSKT